VGAASAPVGSGASGTASTPAAPLAVPVSALTQLVSGAAAAAAAVGAQPSSPRSNSSSQQIAPAVQSGHGMAQSTSAVLAAAAAATATATATSGVGSIWLGRVIRGGLLLIQGSLRGTHMHFDTLFAPLLERSGLAAVVSASALPPSMDECSHFNLLLRLEGFAYDYHSRLAAKYVRSNDEMLSAVNVQGMLDVLTRYMTFI